MLLGSTDSIDQTDLTGDSFQEQSFIIWPTERKVSATDHQEVTIWKGSGETRATIQRLAPLEDSVPPAVTPFVQFAPAATEQRHRSGKRQALRFALLGVMVLSLIVMASLVIPDLYYRLIPESASDVASIKVEKAGTAIGTTVELSATPAPILPAVDPTLPADERLRIPTIGIDATVRATVNPDDALTQGAWMVPDFGRPADMSQPTIIASHRYGWVWWWQSDFGRKNSFYYLPDTKPGDKVEIISGQRRFEYQIYAIEEGQQITDYTADLILYTCKFLNSPQRYFVYARRLPVAPAPTASDSQSGGSIVFDKS